MGRAVCERAAAGRGDTAALRGRAGCAERGCVPCRAGSAAAAAPRRTRKDKAWSAPFANALRLVAATQPRSEGVRGSRSAAVSRAGRDQPQRLHRAGRARINRGPRRLRTRCGWSRRHSRAPRACGVRGARLCPAPSGISRSGCTGQDAQGKIVGRVVCECAAAGRYDTAALRGRAGCAERGCVPCRAGSAAAAAPRRTRKDKAWSAPFANALRLVAATQPRSRPRPSVRGTFPFP